MRQTFVMYANWQPLFDALPDEDAARLIRAIYEYQLSGKEPDQEWSVYPTFLMLKGTMDKDIKAYEEKVERVTKNRSKSDRSQDDISMKSDRSQNDFSLVATDTVTDTNTVTVTETKKPKEHKESYGEMGNVKLTVKEREKLIAEYGADMTERAIDFLDGYIADKGYKSKSNYFAIRRWVMDAVRDKGRASPEKFDVDAYLRERAGL